MTSRTNKRSIPSQGDIYGNDRIVEKEEEKTIPFLRSVSLSLEILIHRTQINDLFILETPLSWHCIHHCLCVVCDILSGVHFCVWKIFRPSQGGQASFFDEKNRHGCLGCCCSLRPVDIKQVFAPGCWIFSPLPKGEKKDSGGIITHYRHTYRHHTLRNRFR